MKTNNIQSNFQNSVEIIERELMPVVGECGLDKEVYDNLVTHIYDIKKEVTEANGKIIRWEEEQSKKIKKYEYMEKNKNISELAKTLDENNFGAYSHCFFNRFETEYKQYMVRMILLGAYTDYDNKLVWNLDSKRGRKYIMADQLIGVLQLKVAEYKRTKKFLLDNKYISIDNDNKVTVNKELIIKGGIKMSNKEFQKLDNDYVRIFDDSIKDIYREATAREHKKLALLFQILPYINVEHNMVCTIETTDKLEINNIESLNLTQLAEEIGYLKGNTNKLKSDLLGIKIKDENVVMVLNKGRETVITINPRLYYKGSDVNQLKSMINLFEVKNKKN